MPELVPVLDLRQNQVVRAIAGRRGEYRPWVDSCIPGHDPLTLARSLLERTSSRELYVADLDAIEGRVPVSPIVLELVREIDAHCWLDVGISAGKSVQCLPSLPNLGVVFGSETVTTPEILEANLRLTRLPVAFSLDLKAGQLIGGGAGWGFADAGDVAGLANQVIARGIRTLILIDLARVGTGSGVGTGAACQAIRKLHPGVRLIAGGGIQSRADVEALGAAGVDAVLVASALHNGKLP